MQINKLHKFIERKTRFYYMIPISAKSSKQVYMQINKLHKFYGDSFKDIFKSITFDNGSEFSRWNDIEQKPKSKEKRTTVYFSRPYHSCDRASNENCNGLIRYFIKKGTDINTIDKETTIDINNKINQKITFDNGSEFSRWNDIEQKPKSKEKRTTVYFSRPYHSCDRASNENCNGVIRYFIKKGTDINTIDKETTIDINNKINQKKRKILGYLSSEELFLIELDKLNVTDYTIFYKI